MMRRKKRGAADDLFSIAAAIPWGAGLVLAVVSYFFIHHYAVAEVPIAIATNQVGQMVAGQLVKSLATYGQYLVPFIFLAGALASFLGRKKREALVRDAAEGNSAEVVRKMSWQDFELFVGEIFRMRGFSVAESGGGGADGGIDLTLRKGKEVFLVQCKRWREFKVPVNVIRELYGVMAAQGAAGGFVITSGVFTTDAQSFAKGRNIELVDGEALEKMLIASSKLAANNHITPKTSEQVVVPAPETAVVSDTNPACPRCGIPMIQRVAKKGPTTGQLFWGCAEFPKCTGVRKFE